MGRKKKMPTRMMRVRISDADKLKKQAKELQMSTPDLLHLLASKKWIYKK